jgi:hypothetical protein
MALTQMLAAVLILFEAARTKGRRLGLVATASILATSTAFTWLFIWPVVITAIILFSCFYMKNKYKHLSLVLLVCSLAFIQVWVQLTITVKKAGVNEMGSVIPINNIFLLGILCMVSMYALVKNKVVEVRVVSLFTAITALFSITVMVYQLISVGELRYYFYKSAHTFILLAAIMLTALIAQALSWFIHYNTASWQLLASSAILLIFASMSLGWSQRSLQANDYITHKPYGISLEMADAINTLYGNSQNSLPNTIAIGSCNRAQDIKAINLITAISGRTSPADAVASAEFYSPQAVDTFEAIKDDQRFATKPLTIISSDYNLEQDLQSYLGKNSRGIKFVDLGGYHSSSGASSACPERLK